MTERELAAQHIADLLREFNKKGQFVKKAYGTEVSLAEAYILIELDLDPTLSAKDLSRILNLNSSTISRYLKSLIDRNYLERRADPQDRRRKILTLKTKGKRFVEKHYQANQQQMAEFTRNLSTSEEIELFGYLKALADGDGALPIPVPPREHPIMIQMRRLARSLEILGRSFVGSKYTGHHYQILSIIKQGAGKIRGKDLASLLTLPKNTVSQILARFEKEQLIYRKPFEDDHRNWGLFLTRQGLQAYSEMYSRLTQRIARALKNLTNEDLKHFARLMEKFVGWEEVSLIMQEQLRAELITPEKLQTTRAFLILELVRSNRLHQVGDCLVGQDNLIFGLFQGDKLSGVCEFKIETDSVVLINFAVSLAFEGTTTAPDFMNRVAIAALQKEKKTKLLIAESSGASGYFLEKGLGQATDGGVLLAAKDL